MYVLSDIFIGDFGITQDFGLRPEYYQRFGINGHNGIDVATPTGTPIVAGADGWVKEINEDSDGYGRYLKVVHNGFFTLYAHLNDVVVKVGDRVIKGQLLGHTNNTGLSSGPHLHFGIAPCDPSGNKTEKGNGYSGYIKPYNNPLVQWQIVNLQAPVVTPVSDSSTPSQALLDQTIKDRDLNHNALIEVASHLGMSLSEDRQRNVLLIKDKIDLIREQEIKYRQENEQLLKELDEEKRTVIALKDELAKIHTEDKDYALKAYEADAKLKESDKVVKEIAKELDVKSDSSDVRDLLPRVMEKFWDLKDKLKKQPTTIDTILSDNLVNPTPPPPHEGQTFVSSSAPKQPILQVVFLTLFGWAFEKQP